MIGKIYDVVYLVRVIKNAMYSCQQAKKGHKKEECERQEYLLLNDYKLPKEIVSSIVLYALIPSYKAYRTNEDILTKLFEGDKALKQMLENELNEFCQGHGATLSSQIENSPQLASMMYKDTLIYFLIKPYFNLS